MKKKIIIISLILVCMMCGIVGCSSESASNDNTSIGGSINFEGKKESSRSTPKNDTDAGLKVVKIDSAEGNLTEDQKAVIEYFDQDYLWVFDYESMRRYPQIFDGSQITVRGTVLKVISMDSEQYQIVMWMNVASLEAIDWITEKEQGAYLLLSGKTGEEWFMEGDVLEVYGHSNGIETLTIDGVSYTIPKIDVHRAYQAQCDIRGGIIYGSISSKFDLPFIKKVAHAIFGNDIEIRKPVVGTDVSEETAMIYESALGVDVTEEEFVVELEDQSSSKFTKFLFSKSGGSIQDIKDATSDYGSGYERYIEFAPDFQHFFLFTYDQGLALLTLEYYDNSFNKIWKREFMETTSAQYDFTKNNIYLTANNELYIINTETGEDTYPPAYVGNKVAIRKLDEGILMISDNKSDGIMMTNLDGTIKWKTNLENDIDYIDGLQIVDNRIIFNYGGSNEDIGYFESYISIDRASGDILANATN